jgi:hypothetical protein
MGDVVLRLTLRFRGETLVFLLIVLLAIPASVSAQGASHRAGLVIRFGDGSILTRCVTFTEPQITGMELLQRAGLAVRVDTNSSFGAGVCKINSQGCDAGRSCFCQCEGAACAYWQYFFLQNGAWKYSVLGAGIHQVTDGAVEGWAWGNNLAPPLMALDEICASSSIAPQPAVVPATQTPAPTLTPPASIPTPTATDMQTMVAATVVMPSTSVPAIVTPTATATLEPLPTPVPSSPTVLPPFIPPPQNTVVPSPVVSYMVFGAIALGLGAWLVIQSRRKA